VGCWVLASRSCMLGRSALAVRHGVGAKEYARELAVCGSEPECYGCRLWFVAIGHIVLKNTGLCRLSTTCLLRPWVSLHTSPEPNVCVVLSCAVLCRPKPGLGEDGSADRDLLSRCLALCDVLSSFLADQAASQQQEGGALPVRLAQLFDEVVQQEHCSLRDVLQVRLLAGRSSVLCTTSPLPPPPTPFPSILGASRMLQVC
jgi:hypothetical protein